MTTHDQIRQSVSKAYARAVSVPKESSGCGCGCGPATTTAALAGYGDSELDEAPRDAVTNAFGCGDPTAMADLEPGQTVVDLGSGAGLDLILAGHKVGPTGRVIGVDMTDEMIDRARANISEAGLADRVEVRRGIIENLPVDDGQVDRVISNCVINLSPDKPAVFAEIARVLRPGGHMLVADMVVDDLPQSIRDNDVLYHGCIGGAISETAYLDGIRAAGLTDVEVRKRYTYEGEQLAYMLGEGLHGDDGGSCCGVGQDGVDAGEVATVLAGKVHSIQVYARKPGN